MTRKNPKVDAFLSQAKRWQPEFRKLRTIALASGLTEDLKWRLPCYSLEGSNVAILQGFKEYCALMFFKGALLKDPRSVLVAPGAAQAARQVRFTNVRDVVKMQPVLEAYISEAIELERAGSKVALKMTSEYAVPEEFQNKLDKLPKLRAAFYSLTPGRQRAYLFHFAAPKRSETRESRVEKCVQRILEGRGLND